MRNWASSGRVKIERAYAHIRDLEAQITDFRDRRPYLVIGEPDFYGRDDMVFYVRVREHLPPHWCAIAADSVHNLHVALDQLWQRAVHGTRHVFRDHFPAYPSLADALKTRFRGKEKGRLKDAVDLLKSVNAFDVGNPFWSIRCFDDADKHDTTALVAAQLTGFSAAINGSMKITHVYAKDSFRVIEDGAILYVQWQQPGAKMNVEHDLAFEVTFEKGGVLEREPVLPTLKNFAAAVDSLADAFVAAGLLG